uniref:GATA-type transcription activator N-terminal domain-containing protein n=1 Tax=Oryza brachyantha TaxID=4533 RepID=J3L5C5_ORYBR
MAMRAITLSHSQSASFGHHQSSPSFRPSTASPRSVKVHAKADEEKGSKQSLFGSITEALDFSQVRSEKDAELLYEAREATKDGGRMTKEQYGALRRKIGGTYKDFFKSYVDVDGEYVEEGWVDKTCKVCKKDTRGEPRQVDKLGSLKNLNNIILSCVQFFHIKWYEGRRSTFFFFD